MTPSFVAIFMVAGTLVGPPYFAGTNESDCKSEALRIIRNIKRGADLMGVPYRPIEFRCQMVGGGQT